jgi:magnesium chelatase family protein
MVARVLSGAVLGIEGYLVEVEVNLAPGVPNFSIVGLPDAAVKESSERVMAAIKNTNLDLPVKRITVNLAPANIKKEGSAFDLPIALGICAANDVLRKDELGNYMILGELSLDGRVKPIKGALSIAVEAKAKGLAGLLLPVENAAEAAVVDGLNVYPVSNLPQAVSFLNGESMIDPLPTKTGVDFFRDALYEIDFTDVKGQLHVKRALEIAAAGGHNIIMLYSIKYRIVALT